MRIKLDNTWLTGDLDDSERSRSSAREIRVNGKAQVQEAHNVGATELLLFARGGAAVDLEFATSVRYSTIGESERRACSAMRDYPQGGTVELYCGNATDGWEVCRGQAVLVGISPTLRGVTLDLFFSLRVTGLDFAHSIAGGAEPVADIDGGSSYAEASGPAAQGSVDGGNLEDIFAVSDPIAIDGGVFA